MFPRSKAILKFRFEAVNSFCGRRAHMDLFFGLFMMWLMKRMYSARGKRQGHGVESGGSSEETRPVSVMSDVMWCAHQNLTTFSNGFKTSRGHDTFNLKCTKSRSGKLVSPRSDETRSGCCWRGCGHFLPWFSTIFRKRLQFA